MGETISEELDFLEWTKKLSERIQVVHTCLQDKRKMLEQDYDVFEALYPFWYNGTCPFYKQVSPETGISVTQADLFNDNISAS